MTSNDHIHVNVNIGLIVPNDIHIPTSGHNDQNVNDPEWLIHRQANLRKFITIALETIGLQLTSIQITERILK